MPKPFQFKRLDHLQICIPKGEEELGYHFYKNILALEEIPKPTDLQANGGFWFLIADIELHIGVEDSITPSKRHPALVVDDLAAAKSYLLSHQVKIKEYNPLPNYNRFSCYDPFGNRIEFLEAI